MDGLVDAIACGALSALTWAGLVWVLPDVPVSYPRAWWQGTGIVAIANMFIWGIVAALKLHVLIWAVAFFALNAIVGKLVLPYLRSIQIPSLWALGILPVAIAIMNVLLGGALGAI